MHDPGVVRSLQRGADWLQDGERIGRREPSIFPHVIFERGAVEQLHDQIGAAVPQLAEIVDVDDVRMAHHVDGARLLNEALDHLLRGGKTLMQHLHRRGSPEQTVTSPVDRAASAPRDHTLDDILARQRSHRKLVRGI